MEEAVSHNDEETNRNGTRKRNQQHPNDNRYSQITSSGLSRKKGRGKSYFRKTRILFRAYPYAMIALLVFWVWFLPPACIQLYRTWKKGRVVALHIDKDYSTITDISELDSNAVAEWCLRGKNDRDCQCTDPLKPAGRRKLRHWERAHHFNVDDAMAAARKGIDVLFLGDAITEQWMGTRLRFPIGHKSTFPTVFNSLFTEKGGGQFEGLALGISGDTSPSLLWRIQNGELPEKLNPPVIWLLIGTHDFGNAWCSPEIVLIGILRIIEEIHSLKPNSILVVNSILPRTFHHAGYLNRAQLIATKKRPTGPSLWHAITSVNDQLRSYCENHYDDKLQFFDATDIFLVDSNAAEHNLKINQTLMEDYLVPSEVGHSVWGLEIVKFMQNLEIDMDALLS